MYGEYSDTSDYEFWQERQRKRWLEKRPTCDWCDMPIEEKYAYRIDDQLICPECIDEYMEENHRVRLPD